MKYGRTNKQKDRHPCLSFACRKSLILGAAARRSASQPLENCLRAVRHGPHFVRSTKPQFSEVIAFRKSRRCAATKNRRTTREKARFPACGKCRPCRMAGKRFFRCPDGIRTPGLMPLPVPRFFEKNRVKLLILRTFIRNINASADFYVSAKLVFRQSEGCARLHVLFCLSVFQRLRVDFGHFDVVY